jgi:glycosyltransferase involved in cell wall biosynthesis
MPRISVILPTLNGMKYLEQAIHSVLTQSFEDLELIIINDGSTDETDMIVNRLIKEYSRIVYIKHEKSLGLQKTLNEGLALSRGEFIARIDDDDIWNDRDKLIKQMNIFSRDRNYVLVGTGMHAVDEQGNKLYDSNLPETDEAIRKNLLFQTSFVHSSVCFRKNAVVKCGGYNEEEEIRHIEDYELWLKLGTMGKLYNIPDHSVTIKLRPGSVMAKNIIEQQKKSLRLIKRFRKNYPGYRKAMIIAYLRLFFRIIIGHNRI